MSSNPFGIVPGQTTQQPNQWTHFANWLMNRIKPQQALPAPGQSPPPAPGLPMWLIQQMYSNMGQGENQGPAAGVPYGALQTTFQNLLPEQYARLGHTRPLGPGEYVTLPDGSYASEEDYTIPVDAQGNAIDTKNQQPDHWRVIPGLWLVNGTPTHVKEDQAAQLAVQSGLRWPQFPTEKQANEQYVNPRESKWESAPQGRTDLQPPIWRY